MTSFRWSSFCLLFVVQTSRCQRTRFPPASLFHSSVGLVQWTCPQGWPKWLWVCNRSLLLICSNSLPDWLLRCKHEKLHRKLLCDRLWRVFLHRIQLCRRLLRKARALLQPCGRIVKIPHRNANGLPSPFHLASYHYYQWLHIAICSQLSLNLRRPARQSIGRSVVLPCRWLYSL